MTIDATVDPNLPIPAPEEQPTRRDEQRSALKDLVELCTECAATEAELDRRRQTELETAKKQADKAAVQIQQHYQVDFQAAQQKTTEAVSQVEAKLKSAAATIETAHENAARRIDSEYEPAARKLQSKIDHDVWLAESVFEVSQNQVRAELKKARDEHEKNIDELEEMAVRAKALLVKYHQSPTAPPDAGERAVPEDVEAAVTQNRDAAQRHLNALRSLFAPGLFVGATPYLAVGVLCAIGAVAGWFIGGASVAYAAVGLGAALVLGLVLGVVLWIAAKNGVQAAYHAFHASSAAARQASTLKLEQTTKAQERLYQQAMERKRSEVQQAKEAIAPLKSKAMEKRNSATAALEAQTSERRNRLNEERRRIRQHAEGAAKGDLDAVEGRRRQELEENQARLSSLTAQTEQRFSEGRATLEARWADGLRRISAPMENQNGSASGDGLASSPAPTNWNDPAWEKWSPPKVFPSGVRFGELQVSLPQIIEDVRRDGKFTLPLPDSFVLPGQLTFPQHASLLIEAGRTGREEAMRTLQMVMMRLLTTLPAGRVHFTILDPVGLGQNFAGFMHLADYDEALVGTRIWTDGEQIEKRLGDLTEHMETVIQKYLRNEFQTIDDYNAQAGELSEPYRFLVVADFPVGFQGDAFRRLSSIASSGARCGVYTLVMRDTRVPLPSGTHLDDVEAHSVTLVQEPEQPGQSGQPPRFVWKDDVFRRFPLRLDPPPESEEFLTKILNEVGRRAKESKRVEVNFDIIAPKPEQFWSMSTADELRVPIGRMGATRLQMMRLGKGVAQHTLIAGKTGSGKSTLLHAMVTNLAMWYSPDEVEFYLVDFKKGVEFKTYAVNALPHARVIAVESDREFGISVLQRLDAELARRGNIYRKVGVQDLAAYRKSPNAEKMPRTLLIVDEFQEFFSEDDKLSQDASLLIDRLVRQGRAFGIHVLLGSQTIGGSGGLSRSTLGQMAVRVALQLSDTDSQLILGDNNSAARLLTRPGEAIYNDAGGLVENNSPFQIAWLGDAQRDRYLERVRALDLKNGNGKMGRPEAVVFEGNAPADIHKNRAMMQLLAGSNWPPASNAPPVAWLGDPVAIKDPTGIPYRRQSGANSLLIGQQEEGAMALMAASIESLALQLPPSAVQFVVLDGTPADSPLATVLPRLKDALPHDMKLVEYRAVDAALGGLGEELKRRQDGSAGAAPPAIFVFIYGLQRYRSLRKQEESFGFSSSGDEPKPPAADKIFADLIREGPPNGMHVVAWVDTAVSIERTFDRGAMREFDYRILFQMSASDSSNLIDSPAANKLGQNRALAYSEELGTIEKFRPYALPDKGWLDELHARLVGRAK